MKEFNNYYFLFLLSLCIAIGWFVAMSPVITFVIFISAVFFVFALKYDQVSVTIPFVAVSLFPSDYILGMNISSPFGYIQPVLPVILILLYLQFIQRANGGFYSFVPNLSAKSGIVFIFVLIVSLALNDPQPNGFKRVISMSVLSVGIVVLVGNARHLNIKHVLSVLFGICALVSLFGMIEFIFGYNPYRDLYEVFWWEQQSGGLWRIFSLMGNPLVLSAYTIMILALLMLLPRKSLIHYVLMLMCSITIGLTFSRSAYIVIVGMYAIYFGVKARKKEALALFAIVCLAAVILTSLINTYQIKTELVDRLLFTDSSKSYTHRATAWERSFDIDDLSVFVLGVGPGNLVKSLSSDSSMELKTFDNAYLEIFKEAGLFGLISFLFFVASPCFDPKNKNKGISFGIFVVFALSSLTFTTYFFQAVWLSYWFIQSVILCDGRKVTSIFASVTTGNNIAAAS